MNARTQRLCVWSGVVFMALFFIGFGVIARYIPPPSPASSAHVVAEHYRHHADAIRTGMLLSMYALTFYVPWIVVLSVQMKRIEGQHTPLSYAQLGLGATLPVAFFPSLYFFQTAAFRPQRSDEAIQQLNDMGWLPFTGLIYTIVLENVVIGIAVLSDASRNPVFPRWYGYLTLWCALLYCPASLDVFFQRGPLAWNGLLSWWLSLISFFVWLVVSTYLMLCAIANQERESLIATPVLAEPAAPIQA